MGRVVSLLGLGLRRTVGRLATADSRRLLLSVLGVALAVAMMTTVTGIALGLAGGSTVHGEDVDYWIVPEGSTASSVAVSVEGPQLGAVHRVAGRLATDSRIDYVTPVQIRILNVGVGNRTEYVLAVGVIPPAGNRTIVGLPTGPLTPGDPHYDNGSYNGTWTGEAVMSQAAAELLHAFSGSELTVRTGGSNRSFTAVDVVQGDLSTGIGPVPIVLVHLAELQTVTGAADGDQADQILVSTNDPGVRSMLEGVYPRTQVIARGGLTTPSLSTTSLPMAVALAALVSSLLVGVLFVATLAGLEVTADRATLAALSALGYSQRSLALLVVAQTVAVAGVGGILGVVLGGLGVLAVNAGAATALGVGQVARFHPLLVLYGVGVALAIGLLAAPYPVWLSRRTDVLEVLDS